MANKHKAKGTAFESAIVTYLLERGRKAYRIAQAGKLDKGDIHLDDRIAVEAKSVKQFDLAGFVEQAQAEAVNAGLPVGVAIIKRIRKGTASAYVVCTLEDFINLIELLERDN